jgi:hypothetical protein
MISSDRRERLDNIITDLVDIYEDWFKGTTNAPHRMVNIIIRLEAFRDEL